MPLIRPRLYHNPSSYYSMIARLALAEGGIAYEPEMVEIHRRLEQMRPDYVRLNPKMTVPTLVLPELVLDQSRAIAAYALSVNEAMLDGETRHLLDLHYDYPIEELTFGRLLAQKPPARIMVPKILARAHGRLLHLAEANPDLGDLYRARAAVFAERQRLFSSAGAIGLAARRQAEALALLDMLEQRLGDGRGFLVPPGYGMADCVFTVFLGRMDFTGLGAEIARRPALSRYWAAMQARSSFVEADIWRRMHLLRFLRQVLLGPPRG